MPSFMAQDQVRLFHSRFSGSSQTVSFTVYVSSCAHVQYVIFVGKIHIVLFWIVTRCWYPSAAVSLQCGKGSLLLMQGSLSCRRASSLHQKMITRHRSEWTRSSTRWIRTTMIALHWKNFVKAARRIHALFRPYR